MYLAGLVETGGHEVRFLTCDADLPTCYTLAFRPHRSAALECTLCRLGGVRSYRKRNISSIGTFGINAPAPEMVARDWGASSASTISRVESDADYASAEFIALKDKLNVPAAISYEAARAWIDREKLDAVIAFNGRMDATRGIMEAAMDAGIRYISMERTWFGDGLQLLPDESCLGLRSTHRLVEEWSRVPLTGLQARRAAAIIAGRFLRSNTKEWRAYNVSAAVRTWPAQGSRRVLLVPSSRNEVWGHPDWTDGWPTRLEAYNALIAHWRLSPDDLVLRAHPNWGEMQGKETGIRSENYYRDWAQARGITFIASTSNTSTLGLIEQADAVVVAGGSAALESAAIGKRVLALSASSYSHAGFEESAYGPEEIASIRPLESDISDAERRDIARKALRFVYTCACRAPQYVNYVSCILPTQYKYYAGADPQRIVDLIRSGRLEADDSLYAQDPAEEDAVLDMIEAREWQELAESAVATAGSRIHIRRRPLLRLIDGIRARLPRGDR